MKGYNGVIPLLQDQDQKQRKYDSSLDYLIKCIRTSRKSIFTDDILQNSHDLRGPKPKQTLCLLYLMFILK